MTSGGWHSHEQRHGRHRQGATGAAWTPVVRPTDAGPAHARRDGFIPFMRPSDTGSAWPASEVLTRRPGWPVEPEVPVARQADQAGWARPAQRERRPAHPAPEPAWPTEAECPEGPPHGVQPKRRTISADMVLDTVPMGRTKPRDEAVVYVLPETTATGLRKFDLGNVPASVTPPRSWRRAAWFAVGTSAAVVLGLTVAAAELMGRPVSDDSLIDAMPAYPTGPLTLDELPHDRTTTDVPSAKPTTSRHGEPSTPDAAPSRPSEPQEPTRDTITGSTTGQHTVGAPSHSYPPGQGTTATTSTQPNRTTVGPAPVTPTDPQEMGDRTEEYFRLVTTSPAAAHAMTTGGMAREGAEGIEARYVGVRRVEVREITIDRNQAITTSTVKIVREDGTVVIEHRQLTFTWGGDPKITNESTTG